MRGDSDGDARMLSATARRCARNIGNDGDEAGARAAAATRGARRAAGGGDGGLPCGGVGEGRVAPELEDGFVLGARRGQVCKHGRHGVSGTRACWWGEVPLLSTTLTKYKLALIA